MAHEPRNSADDRLDRRQFKPVVTIVTGFVLVLVFYVLSPFPVFAVVARSGLSNSEEVGRLVERFYFPLEWAYEQYPAVQQFYDAGFRLFGIK